MNQKATLKQASETERLNAALEVAKQKYLSTPKPLERANALPGPSMGYLDATTRGGRRHTQSRKEIDFIAKADEDLKAIDAAMELHESRQGKPNQELIDANQRVILLQQELEAATRVLQAVRQKGSFLEQLDHAVLRLESSIKRHVSQYHTKVADQLTSDLFGYDGGYANAAQATKDAVKQHRRLSALGAFYVPDRPTVEQPITPEYLFDRARKAIAVLERFKTHVAADQAEQEKKRG